jgi:nucleoside 2-deoxyribosyltransferase
VSEVTEEVAPLCYVAGPYGDAGGWVAIDKNIGVAREASIWLVKQGFFFLCPHLNSAHFEHLTPEATIAHWYAQDLRLMEMCDVMIVCGKWQTSKGVGKELQVAKEKGMPVFDFTTEKGQAELLSWRDEWVTKKLGEQLMAMVGDEAPSI